MIHGDDFVATGLSQHLEWLHLELEKTALLKRVGVLGLDPAKGDVQEVRVLNRVLWIDKGGVTYEADPRQVEKLLESLKLEDARKIATPGVKPLPEQILADTPLPAD